MGYKTYSISWNITKRCNLHCSHCYLDASNRMNGCEDELTREECLGVIDQIAEVNKNPFLILTGGEPLLRDDIFDISEYASRCGFFIVIGTNGLPLDDKTVKRIKECGVKGLGISIDSISPYFHDTFRGINGAWDSTIRGIEAAKRAGLEFLLQTTVTRENYNEIPEIIEFAYKLGAKVFNLFFLVCTGRGQGLTDITSKQYEGMLNNLYENQKRYEGEMLIGAKCAPHYKRVIYGHNPDSPLLMSYTGGCPAGTHYCRITPEGDITPCPYMPLKAGNLREKTFKEIWDDSPILKSFREPNLGGRCGECEFKILCGGCRARAYAETGDYLSEDPWCEYRPGRYGYNEISLKEEDTFGLEEEFSLPWSAEAKERLAKIPSFARGMVIKGVEYYAKGKGYEMITADIMTEARERLVGNRMRGKV